MSIDTAQQGKSRRKPRYLDIAHSILKRIRSGYYPVGTLLPTEGEMCSEFEVSRFTVREAIRQLQTLGTVESRQGQGTRVVATHEVRHYSTLLQTVEDVERHGILTRMVDIRTSNVEADEKLAAALPCDIGQHFLKIECFREPLGRAIELPVAWNEIYLIEEYAGVRDLLGKRDVHVLTMLEENFGEKIAAIDQEISGLILEGEMAKRLKVEPGSAGLRLKRAYTGRGGRHVLFGFNTYPADRFTFRMQLQDRGAAPRNSGR